ncbi:MAG: serine/threonine-protein phosphatase [Planctomycetes bacterium]|nr:serine/threonine-protein phosphatase [Planctomycetota bacterium]
MPQAHVQVVVGGQTMPTGLEAALRQVGATASFEPISEVLRSGVRPTADAVVVIPPDDAQANREGLRRLFGHVASRPRATLVIQPEGNAVPPPTLPPTVPVSFSSRTGVEELAARISTMIEMRSSLESLHRGNASARLADEQLARQYQRQLRIASQVQRELLPHALPRVDGISFTVVYRPTDYVSGDIYDIRRLDNGYVALALVDAEGHGISAALLTVFIKRALPNEGRRGKIFRPLRPDEVLTRLNDELLEAGLSEAQFAAAVYALIDVRTRRVELARAGAPYPILRHADGRCRLLHPAGPLIGVVPNATFTLESFELAPGESLVLYSDGLERVLRHEGSRHNASAMFKQRPDADPDHDSAAPDRAIAATDWYARLGRQGVPAALDHLTARHSTLRRLGHELDDLTVLAISAGQ